MISTESDYFLGVVIDDWPGFLLSSWGYISISAFK